MTEPRKPSLILPVAGAVLLLAGYVGAYYAMVYPYDGMALFPSRRNGTVSWGVRPAWERFFAPIHWLDRRLRPDVWEPTP